MLRTILILGLAAGWVAAGEAPLDAFLYEKDFVLEAGGDEPLLAVHEMEEAGYEVHLLLEFPVGLYRITEMGKLKEAIAGIMLEYNRADLPTDEKNPFRPAEFQQDANAEWNAGGAGEDVISGIWLTRGETTARVERVLIFSLPAFGRYRIRMSGLFENTRHMRRVPTLVGVAEVRSLTARGAGPEDVVDDVAEEEAEEVFEEEYGDEPETEVIVVSARVVFAGPPACCPFCRAPFIRGQVTIGDCRHYSCSLCSGMVHCYRDGRRHCSNLRGGRRHKYDFRNGRPVRFDGRESAYPRRDRGAGDGAKPRRRLMALYIRENR